MKLNPLFYEPGGLSVDEYRQWLRDTGVDYVALPDAELDASAEAEVALLRRGQPGLELAWEGDDWTVWRWSAARVWWTGRPSWSSRHRTR